MELWEVLDGDGNPTGEIMEKYDKKVFERGMYHLGTDLMTEKPQEKKIKKLIKNAEIHLKVCIFLCYMI